MQTVSTNLQTIYDSGINSDADHPTYDFSTVVEFYAYDYVPPAGGFDPADAAERFAGISLTWNGLAYRREVLSYGDVNRSMGKTPNSATVRMSNVSRYAATWVVNNEVEGMWCVIRDLSRSVTDSSNVLMAGRVDKPVEIDRKTATFSIKANFGNLEYNVPVRKFVVEDPEGRDPSNVLFEGFRSIALHGQFDRVRLETKVKFLFFRRTKKVTYSDQWSSVDGTPYGNPIPEIFGRCQVELIAIAFADIGGAAKMLGVAGNGKVSAINNIRNVEDPNRQPNNITVHLGDVGGTGTNALLSSPPYAANTGDQQFPGFGVFSKTAYVGMGIPYGDPETVEDPITIVAVVDGKIIPLPDATGVFNTTGFTDNPAYLTRFLLTDSNFGRINTAFIADPACVETANYCNEPLEDTNDEETIYVSNTDLAEISASTTRARSSGLLDYATIGTAALPDNSVAVDVPVSLPTAALIAPDFDGYDDDDPGVITVNRSRIRKRYTSNFTITEEVPLIDLLYDTVLKSYRGYLVINSKGQIEIRSEKPADNTVVRTTTTVGATTITVNDVEPWKNGKLLLRGKVLIGSGLTTSEVRKVTNATYSSAGNSITLVAGGTDGTTGTASGATLGSGSTSVASFGTVTVGGTTNAGATVYATISGTTVTHTLNGFETTAQAAKMLALRINANTTLRNLIKASYDPLSPNVVKVTAKVGVLTLSQALVSNHTAGQEIIRVMMSFSDASRNADGSVSTNLKRAGLTRNNIQKDSSKWPMGSKQSSINQVQIEFNSAPDDFAKTKLIVNDTPHQTKIGKVNTLKVSGAAIDNLHQASRIANAALSKNREGDWYASWQSSDPNTMLLEEGDVVCWSDDSGGLINVVLRVEEVRISDKRVTTVTARKYSTNMFSDTVVARPIKLPTTLRYTTVRPTILELVDGPPVNDGDSAFPGAYAFATYDDAVKGDWQGSTLWADYGDGYKQVGTFTAAATLGYSTTTLATQAVAGWDNTHSISFTSKHGTWPGNATQAEIEADPERNLVIAGDEIFQYKTKSVVGSTITLSGLYRGLYGTNNKAHATGERVALFNGAELFVRIDPARLNLAFNYKAPTTNQDLSAVTPKSFTWTGKSVDVGDVTGFAIGFDGTSLVHTWTPVKDAGKLADLYQISTSSSSATFIVPGNLLFEGNALKWADSALSTDPRSGTRYIRAVRKIGNTWSAGNIASASYNVTAPAAPTITLLKPGVNTVTFRITSGESAAKRITFKKTVYQVYSDAGYTTVVASKDAGRPYPNNYVDVTISKPAGIKTIYVKAWFVDVFGAGSVGTY